MLGKRSRPSIGKLAGVLRIGIMDSNTSPRSPLECKMQSPRGPKNYDQVGIGLGIAVALDKPTNDVGPGEILAKYAIRDQYSTRSRPIPINPTARIEMDMMEGLDEEFTYVTCHGPNKSITTRVYYDNGEFGKISQNVSVLNISPARLTSISGSESGSETGFDFLSSCHLCRKTLHGKDIYMYRGEKAFCSEECRQRQIGIEERKEQCRLEASRSGDVSSSPCMYTSRGEIFFSAGIVAV